MDRNKTLLRKRIPTWEVTVVKLRIYNYPNKDPPDKLTNYTDRDVMRV